MRNKGRKLSINWTEMREILNKANQTDKIITGACESNSSTQLTYVFYGEHLLQGAVQRRVNCLQHLFPWAGSKAKC